MIKRLLLDGLAKRVDSRPFNILTPRIGSVGFPVMDHPTGMPEEPVYYYERWNYLLIRGK